MITRNNEEFVSLKEVQVMLSKRCQAVNRIIFQYQFKKYEFNKYTYVKLKDIENIGKSKPKYSSIKHFLIRNESKKLGKELDENKKTYIYGTDFYETEYLEEVFGIKYEDVDLSQPNRLEEALLDLFKSIENKEDVIVSDQVIKFLTGYEGDIEANYSEYRTSNKAYKSSLVYKLLDEGYSLTDYSQYVFSSQIADVIGCRTFYVGLYSQIAEVEPLLLRQAKLYSPQDVEKLKLAVESFKPLNEAAILLRTDYDLIKSSLPESCFIINGKLLLVDIEEAKKCLFENGLIEKNQGNKNAFDQDDSSINEKSLKRTNKQFEYMAFDEIVDDITEKYIHPIRDKRPEIAKTIDLAENYLHERVYTKPPKDVVESYTGRCHRMSVILNTLTKDINEYSVLEIQELGNSLPTIGAKKELATFTKHIEGSGRATIQMAYRNTGKFDAYTDEEWLKFLRILTDVERHVEKAESNYKYAVMWLLLLCHTFLSWRIGDYLSFPKPSTVPEGDDWIIDESTAIIITNNVRQRCIGLKANKTGAELNFPEIPRPIIVPFTTAITICCKHMRDDLFNNRDITAYRKVLRECGFQNELEGFEFYSMRANKTIETGIWKHALKLDNINTVAYSVAASMRSHKRENGLGYANTTEQYIMPEDNFNMKIQQAICKRGLFGFNCENILNIVTYGNADYAPDEDKETALLAIKDAVPQSITNDIARSMNLTLDRRRSFVKEWNKNPGMMAFHLSKALQTESNSKMDSVICCNPKGHCDSMHADCKVCFYGLFTLQALPEVGRKTLETIKEIEYLLSQTDIAYLNTSIVVRKKLINYLELISTIRSMTTGNMRVLADNLMHVNEIRTKVLEIEQKRTEVLPEGDKPLY